MIFHSDCLPPNMAIKFARKLRGSDVKKIMRAAYFKRKKFSGFPTGARIFPDRETERDSNPSGYPIEIISVLPSSDNICQIKSRL